MTYPRQLGWLYGFFTLIALALASGCGGGGASKLLYAVGLGSSNVAILSVSSSGTLTSVASVSAGIGSAPSAIAIDPQRRFVYILDSASGGATAGGVSQYVLNKTGTLTQATFSSTNGTTPAAGPAETGVNPKSIAVDITGAFVFVANQGFSNPAPGSCLPPVPPAGSTGACPSISVFSIDQVGGTLTEVQQTAGCIAGVPVPCPLMTTAPPTALATTGKMLFVAMANAGSGLVSTYTFNSNGILTSPSVSTLPLGIIPSAMALDPSGKFLFLVGSNSVQVVGIDSSGKLTATGAPVPTGTNPVSVRISPSGGFLYTANQDSNDISAFSIDSSGTLKPVNGSPFALGRPGPSYVTTDASGGLLFVAAAASGVVVSNTISVFSIDSSGALKELSGSPSPSVVIDPVALASIN
jgi:6-phosphogluconolactonase